MARKATEAARMLDAEKAMRAIAADYEELLRRKGPAHLTEADWRRIAENAGALQRRARILGGLGRGG